ncbi:hypothetical protein ZHAS_00012162 [Anopheles sinensis]|uniref:Uncharacterized protein n=1 Tax=Anopheles sinensis TaxID=74873 RepID=A0A084W234_ANOSI|nr:hypothetical protein ZHAS_00012162 [Anopheles sinensis]
MDVHPEVAGHSQNNSSNDEEEPEETARMARNRHLSLGSERNMCVAILPRGRVLLRSRLYTVCGR